MAQQSTKATTLASKPDLKKALAMSSIEETGHIGFGPVQDINEIPGGQFGDLDIELGRRLTDAPLRPSDPLSIEQGRRESGLRESEKFDVMQFSPLRTPTKDVVGGGSPFDAQDNAGPMMDDDYGWVNPEEQPQSEGVQPMSPVAESVVTPAKKTPRKRAAKKGVLALDERTEITNQELQAHLRSTEDICEEEEELEAGEEVSEFAKSTSIFDLPLFATLVNQNVFAGLFKAARPTAATRAARRKQSEVEEANVDASAEAPMMDDDYGWVNPGHEDAQQQQQADSENQVPDANSNQAEYNLSGLQSPMKRLSISGLSQASASSQSTFSRTTVDTLAIWQAEFSAVKNKSLRLEADLMTAMAGQGMVTKRVAASAFFEALVLRGKGLVEVRQEKAFAPITVHAKHGLFNAIACEQP